MKVLGETLFLLQKLIFRNIHRYTLLLQNYVQLAIALNDFPLTKKFAFLLKKVNFYINITNYLYAASAC